jgi:hypothetical protein
MSAAPFGCGISVSRGGSAFGLGFAKANDAVTCLPLAAFLEQLDPFKAFEDIAFCAGGAGGAEATML